MNKIFTHRTWQLIGGTLIVVVMISWYFHSRYERFGGSPECRSAVYKKYFGMGTGSTKELC